MYWVWVHYDCIGKNLNDFMCGRLYKFTRFTRNDTVSGLIMTASNNTLI